MTDSEDYTFDIIKIKDFLDRARRKLQKIKKKMMKTRIYNLCLVKID